VMAAAISLGVIGSAAMAQEPPPRPWAIKAGIFRPDSRDWRRVGNDIWFLVGADYIAQVTPEGAELVGTVDYGSGGSGNRRWSVQGIYRLRAAPGELAAPRVYYGAGVGVYFARVESRIGDLPAVRDTGTRFGIPLVAGFDITPNFFGELKYDAVFGRLRGTRLGGFSVMAGYRL
jgi:hypothetical protein